MTRSSIKACISGVLRLDVDCRGGAISHPIPRQPLNGHTAHYFIPNDNPFVGQSNVLEEFFCLGLRSPHRMTYDPPTGRIFIGDVGESAREEVDVIEPGESGLNFQWNYCEGTLGQNAIATCIGISRGPVLDYPHTDGRAVIGGYVYRGKKFAADLGGKYIFGDNVMRTIWAMDETTTPVKKNLLCVMPKGTGPNSGSDYTGLSSFGAGCRRRNLFLPDEQHWRTHFHPGARRTAAADPSVSQIAFANRRVSATWRRLTPDAGFGSLQRQYSAVVGWRGQNPLAGVARRHDHPFRAQRRMDVPRRHRVCEKF